MQASQEAPASRVLRVSQVPSKSNMTRDNIHAQGHQTPCRCSVINAPGIEGDILPFALTGLTGGTGLSGTTGVTGASSISQLAAYCQPPQARRKVSTPHQTSTTAKNVMMIDLTAIEMCRPHRRHRPLRSYGCHRCVPLTCQLQAGLMHRRCAM